MVPMKRSVQFVLLMVLLAVAWNRAIAVDAQPSKDLSAEDRGYWFLTQKAYLPPDFSAEIFDNVWKKWPEPLRSEAEKASPEARRKMAFSRYGLTPRPEDPAKPLQYVVDPAGNWTMNCFACHGGK